MLRGRTVCSGQALQMTLEKPFALNKYVCANIDIKISWSTLSYCHRLTERQHRKGASTKIVLPPSQHKNQGQTAGGQHSWDYLEARNIICDPNKKHFQLTSLWNRSNTNTFRLLISHDLVIISQVPLQASASYTWSAQPQPFPHARVVVLCHISTAQGGSHKEAQPSRAACCCWPFSIMEVPASYMLLLRYLTCP